MFVKKKAVYIMLFVVKANLLLFAVKPVYIDLFVVKADCIVICSESSMFVSQNRFILKTCGQTTLLLAVQPLINLVREKYGFNIVKVCIYSK